MSERFGKCRFFDRTEPAFAAVRKLHKKRFDLNEFAIKSGTSEEMVLVRLNHLRRVLQHSSVVEPNRFVSLGVTTVRLQLKQSTTDQERWADIYDARAGLKAKHLVREFNGRWTADWEGR